MRGTNQRPSLPRPVDHVVKGVTPSRTDDRRRGKCNNVTSALSPSPYPSGGSEGVATDSPRPCLRGVNPRATTPEGVENRVFRVQGPHAITGKHVRGLVVFNVQLDTFGVCLVFGVPLHNRGSRCEGLTLSRTYAAGILDRRVSTDSHVHTRLATGG